MANIYLFTEIMQNKLSILKFIQNIFEEIWSF